MSFYLFLQDEAGVERRRVTLIRKELVGTPS